MASDTASVEVRGQVHASADVSHKEVKGGSESMCHAHRPPSSREVPQLGGVQIGHEESLQKNSPDGQAESADEEAEKVQAGTQVTRIRLRTARPYSQVSQHSVAT